VTFDGDLLADVVGISQATRYLDDFSRPVSVRGSIATFEQAQAMAQLNGRNTVSHEDVEKAAKISLEGRTEISAGSRYYDTPEVLLDQVIRQARKTD